ncbi:MAG: hypothetical protein Q7K43_00245, partial [Candidatus Woesearchaeota archaeon]|nr:hypothetical protein [Candidatus Woesearchaeota archaeon]
IVNPGAIAGPHVPLVKQKDTLNWNASFVLYNQDSDTLLFKSMPVRANRNSTLRSGGVFNSNEFKETILAEVNEAANSLRAENLDFYQLTIKNVLIPEIQTILAKSARMNCDEYELNWLNDLKSLNSLFETHAGIGSWSGNILEQLRNAMLPVISGLILEKHSECPASPCAGVNVTWGSWKTYLEQMLV